MRNASLLLALLLLIPAAAVAQLQLYVAPPNTEILLSGFYDLGSAPIGDVLPTRFRVRNTGTSSATVTNIRVAGTGFSIPTPASLPYVIAPGLNLDFTVRFQARDHGAYSANLTVNGMTVLLRATALPGAVVRANGASVIAGSSIDFGRVERGSTSEVTFELANTADQAITVRSVQLTGAEFRSERLPAATDLAPGATVSFPVRFAPQAAGVFTGSLLIDNREFRLTGTATEPPFTRPSVIVDSAAGESARQGRVSVRFASPSRAAGAGALRINFQPAPSLTDNDTGIQFPASGSRMIPFTVKEGDAEAHFGDAAEAVFQTGTTVGTIVLTAEIGGFTEQATVAIAGSAVKFDQSTAARSGSSLEVRVTGFDNTQSASEVTFTFFNQSGAALQPGVIKVNVRDDFKRYFESSTLGGTFALRATFPVAGPINEVGSVEIELVNSGGSAKTTRLRF